MSKDAIKDAITKTAQALEAELKAGKHKGNEKLVQEALAEARKVSGGRTDRAE